MGTKDWKSDVQRHLLAHKNSTLSVWLSAHEEIRIHLEFPRIQRAVKMLTQTLGMEAGVGRTLFFFFERVLS